MAHFDNLSVYTKNGTKMIDSIDADENWHIVGATGEPAFQNSWTNVGGDTIAPTAFRKDAEGVVHIIGYVTGGGGATYIFTLPIRYRPSIPVNALIFGLTGNSAVADIRIYPTGEVYMAGVLNTLIPLSIHFYTDN